MQAVAMGINQNRFSSIQNQKSKKISNLKLGSQPAHDTVNFGRINNARGLLSCVGGFAGAVGSVVTMGAEIFEGDLGAPIVLASTLLMTGVGWLLGKGIDKLTGLD